MAIDVRLAVPVAGAWAALALTASLPGAQATAALAALAAIAAACVTLMIAARLDRGRSALVLMAVTCAAMGLVLAVAAARQPPSVEGCDTMTLRIDEHGGTPARVTIERAECRDRIVEQGSAVLLGLADSDGAGLHVALGDLVEATCDTWRADDGTWMLDCEHAAVTGRAWWAAWSDDVRTRLATAASTLPGDGAALLPGLAIGDTSAVDDDLEAAMRDAGLTHLTAVSGANCAIIVALGFGLGIAVGLGRTGRVVVAGVALAGFVVLVGPDPSVLRASAMAVLALIGLWRGTPRAGIALVALAVLAALLVLPSLAVSAGFALSVLATCGLLLHGLPLTMRLARRLPLWLAASIAVPLAAQLWCLPVLVALDARLGLVTVPANVLAAPAAPAATVLGLVTCAVASVSPALAAASAWLGWVPAAWIGQLARLAERLPGSAPWPAGMLGIACAALMLAIVIVAVARGRVGSGLLGAVAVAAIASSSVAVPTALLTASVPSWTLAQCDVGQGSATLLRAGAATVLVDTGPDPAVLESCLSLFGVSRIDLLVLTHFDLDHVGGAAAVLGETNAVVHGPEDVDGQALVADFAAAGAAVTQVGAGDAIELGAARLDVLWPPQGAAPGNASSVVVALQQDALSIMVLGDLDAAAQRRLTPRVGPVDVVVVAHHGSGDQDLGLYERLSPNVAIVPVGENDYGHPVPEFLDALADLGILTVRTDVDGAIALDGELVWLEHVGGPP